MSIKTWCIIGMIVSAIVGFLRTRGREGAGKTAIIILHTIAFVIFLLGAIVLNNQGM